MGPCLSSLSSKKTPPAARTQTGAASASSSSALAQRMQEKGNEKFGERGSGSTVSEGDLHLGNGATDVACFFSQKGEKGINQDAMVVWEKFSSSDDTIFCGVFDGHGPDGHLISERVRDSLPLKLHNQWAKYEPEDMSCFGDLDMCWAEPEREEESLPDVYMPLQMSLLKAFISTDRELKYHPQIDWFSSGTTAVTVIKQGPYLIVGNLGDSRAILGTRDKDNKLVHVPLTSDLIPTYYTEAPRFHFLGARVFPTKDNPETPRVWLPDVDSPGLAVARAFGDFILKDHGVIPIPVISYRRLTEKDEFVVLASDGVWDVVTNEEVVNMVASTQTRSTAAKRVVDYAVQAWQLVHPDKLIDHISVVCLYFDGLTSSNQYQKDATKGLPGLMRTLRYDTYMAAVLKPLNPKRAFTRAHTSFSDDDVVPARPQSEPKKEQVQGNRLRRCHSSKNL